MTMIQLDNIQTTVCSGVVYVFRGNKICVTKINVTAVVFVCVCLCSLFNCNGKWFATVIVDVDVVVVPE